MIIGEWGDEAETKERKAVSLFFKKSQGKPSFMVVDAAQRPVSKSELVEKSLNREEVIGTTFAKKVFELVDVIWINDRRLKKIKESLGKGKK